LRFALLQAGAKRRADFSPSPEVLISSAIGSRSRLDSHAHIWIWALAATYPVFSQSEDQPASFTRASDMTS